MTRATTLPPTSAQNAIRNPSIWNGNIARRDATVTPVRKGPAKLARNTRTNGLAIARAPMSRVNESGKSCTMAITGTAARAIRIVGINDTTMALTCPK